MHLPFTFDDSILCFAPETLAIFTVWKLNAASWSDDDSHDGEENAHNDHEKNSHNCRKGLKLQKLRKGTLLFELNAAVLSMKKCITLLWIIANFL